MTDIVNWIDFKIVGNKRKYKHSEPVPVSGKLESSMKAPVQLSFLYKNSKGNWEKPKYNKDIPEVWTSKDDHSDNRTFVTSIQLNKFYDSGNYKIKAEYATKPCPTELEFEIIN